MKAGIFITGAIEQRVENEGHVTEILKNVLFLWRRAASAALPKECLKYYIPKSKM